MVALLFRENLGCPALQETDQPTNVTRQSLTAGARLKSRARWTERLGAAPGVMAIAFTNRARTRITSSVFTATFLIAVLTVASPQFLPCPARDDGLRNRTKQRGRGAGGQHDQWRGKKVLINDDAKKQRNEEDTDTR